MLYPKNGWMTIVSQNVIKEELEKPSNFWSRTIVALQLKSVCHDHGSCSMEKYGKCSQQNQPAQSETCGPKVLIFDSTAEARHDD